MELSRSGAMWALVLAAVVEGAACGGGGNPPGTASDATAPTVVLTWPLEGATVITTLDLIANVTDESGIAEVVLEIDGVPTPSVTFAEASAGVWEATCDRRGLGWSAGTSPSFRVCAVDASANRGCSPSRRVTVADPDTAPPVVVLLSPEHASTVTTSLVVNARITDESGFVSVEVEADGVPTTGIRLGEVNYPPRPGVYQAILDPRSRGWSSGTSHELRVCATDGPGNRACSAAASIAIADTAPALDYPALLEGSWTRCYVELYDYLGNWRDHRDVVTFHGNQLTLTATFHESADGTCRGIATPLAGSNHTFDLGNLVAASLGEGGPSVMAREFDWHWESGVTTYLLVHVDVTAGPDQLFWSNVYSGSTPATRPSYLDLGWSYWRQ